MSAIPTVSTPAAASRPEPVLVRVTDIDISFGQMIVLMVKLAIAAIPAAILLFIIGLVFAVVFGGLIGGLGSMAR
jgi:hypothetical protein